MAEPKTGDSSRTSLVIPRDEAMPLVAMQYAKGVKISIRPIMSKVELDDANNDMDVWSDFTAEVLRQIAINDRLVEDFTSSYFGFVGGLAGSFQDEVEDFKSILDRRLTKLEAILKRLAILPENPPKQTHTNGTVQDVIVAVLRRFDVVARQLRHRRGERPSLIINDEYDVQDLLHALLKIHISDVRPEEYTPSYAGGSSKMDFLLKREQTVVETKMTRAGLGDKELGEQLLIDVGKYQAHSDCKTLICFVYDPSRLLRNPAGLERDLTKSINGMSVVTIVSPSE